MPKESKPTSATVGGIAAPTHIRDLTPLGNANPRRHNQRSIGEIADSLQAIGAARSIVIDEAGVILAGNGTVEAAGQAGITKVLTVDVDGETIVAVRRTGLTEAQKAELAIRDNRAGEHAEWDVDILQLLIQANELDAERLGFNDGEIEALLGEVDKAEAGKPAKGSFDVTAKCSNYDEQLLAVSAIEALGIKAKVRRAPA